MIRVSSFKMEKNKSKHLVNEFSLHPFLLGHINVYIMTWVEKWKEKRLVWGSRKIASTMFQPFCCLIWIPNIKPQDMEGKS